MNRLAQRRADDDDVFDARHLGGDGRHEHGGGQGRGATGDVEPHPLDGADKLSERAAQLVGEPTGQRLAAVKLADAVRGDFEGGAGFRVKRGQGSRQGFSGDADWRISGEPIQLAAPLAQGGVAPGADVAQNAAHGLLGRNPLAKGSGDAVKHHRRYVGFIGGDAFQDGFLGGFDIVNF